MKIAIAAAALLVAMPFIVSPAGADQKPVEKSGQDSALKLEQVLSGYLKDLDGKYKVRVSEVTYAPGGFIGTHFHAGPGVRCVTEGELSYEQPDKTTIYRKGDCFYESGAVSHTAHNLTKSPVVLLNFEILPADWSGASTLSAPPKP